MPQPPTPSALRRLAGRVGCAALLGFVATSAAPASAHLDVAAATLYVDGRIGVESCEDYEPASRSCGAGAATAFGRIEGAAAAAAAGDIVELREGRYAEPLIPQHSGQPGAPITFRRHGDEHARIEGAELDPAIDISGRSHIVIEGLEISGVRRWLWALDTQHSRIQGNLFQRALHTGGSAKTGLFFQEATFNQILDNRIVDSTQDNLALIASDRNLVAGNTIHKAAHVLWVIKCGSFNVIRDNHFHNEDQKIGEIYDCWDVGFDHEFRALDATKRNLVEGNDFAYTPSSGNSSPYAGIQYAGQAGIIRRNRFHNTVGPGLSMTLYPDEATYNTDNRVVHNLFYASDFAGIEIAGSQNYAFDNNVLTNNLLAASRFVANDQRWPWYTDELDGRPVQLKTGRLDGFRFDSNGIFSDDTADNADTDNRYLITYGLRTANDNPPPRSVAAWEQAHPALFLGSVMLDPRFEDAAEGNFSLSPSSPMIDAGAFLTRAATSGSGTRLPVHDSGYFYDGYGIVGEVGDLIRLEGRPERARIVAVDDAAGELELDRAMTWVEGQGVSLDFQGARPDIGPAEHDGPAPPVATATMMPTPTLAPTRAAPTPSTILLPALGR